MAYIGEFAVCVVMKQMRELGISDLALDGVDVGLNMSIGGEDVKVTIKIKVEKETGEGEGQ